jgi:hypothetical protein
MRLGRFEVTYYTPNITTTRNFYAKNFREILPFSAYEFHTVVEPWDGNFGEWKFPGGLQIQITRTRRPKFLKISPLTDSKDLHSARAYKVRFWTPRTRAAIINDDSGRIISIDTDGDGKQAGSAWLIVGKPWQLLREAEWIEAQSVASAELIRAKASSMLVTKVYKARIATDRRFISSLYKRAF